MNIFLTGASGYIGRHVALELLSRGYNVSGLARAASPRTEALPTVSWRFAGLADFNAYQADIDAADAVIHCAMDYTADGENTELDSAVVAHMESYPGHFIYTGNLFADRQRHDDLLPEAVLAENPNWRSKHEARVMDRPAASSVIRLGFVHGSEGGYFWDILSPGTVAHALNGHIPDVLWPMIHVRDVAALYASVVESRATGIFHAWDGETTRAAGVIRVVHNTYVARNTPAGDPLPYVNKLLQSSIRTTNERAKSTGWHPSCGVMGTKIGADG